MKRRKILGIVVLLCVVIACVSLLFLPIDRKVYVLLSPYSTYEGRSGKYLKMSGNVYVNAEDFPDLPELQPGDVLEITHYRSHILHGLRGGTYFDDIINIKKLHSADWGVSLTPAQVSATGIELSMGAYSKIYRELKISAYSLDLAVDNQWQPLSPLTQAVALTPISFTDGTSVTLDWESIYGVLEPGQYRLCVTISYKTYQRNYTIAFVVPKANFSTLEEAIDRSIYYYLSKEILDPSKYSNDFQRIPQEGNAGSLPDLKTDIIAGTAFDQIAYGYEIYEYKQDGDLHNYKIIGLCRGYNRQIPAAEFGAPIWLTIRQTDATTFDVISFKMPYRLTWSKSCSRFPPSARGQIWMLYEFRDRLRAACDTQVVGGVSVPAVQGHHYIYLKEDSSDAIALLKAITDGQKISAPERTVVNYTVLVGDKMYYVIRDWVEATDVYIYTLYDVHGDTYTKLYTDGYSVIKRIGRYPDAHIIDDP